jgi:hypothetical protein
LPSAPFKKSDPVEGHIAVVQKHRSHSEAAASTKTEVLAKFRRWLIANALRKTTIKATKQEVTTCPICSWNDLGMSNSLLAKAFGFVRSSYPRPMRPFHPLI